MEGLTEHLICFFFNIADIIQPIKHIQQDTETAKSIKTNNRLLILI